MTNASAAPKNKKTIEITGEYLNALRKAVGLQIDPETAEVDWNYARTLDPYGDDPNLPEEYQQVGRAYFARNPTSDVWVWFGDLPHATRVPFGRSTNRLWRFHRDSRVCRHRTAAQTCRPEGAGAMAVNVRFGSKWLSKTGLSDHAKTGARDFGRLCPLLAQS